MRTFFISLFFGLMSSPATAEPLELLNRLANLTEKGTIVTYCGNTRYLVARPVGGGVVIETIKPGMSGAPAIESYVDFNLDGRIDQGFNLIEQRYFSDNWGFDTVSDINTAEHKRWQTRMDAALMSLYQC